MERLKGIEVFAASIEAGSFTAAAERLNLTNSAVGKTIARLEARLGTKLLIRTTRRLSMTDEGAAFYDTCKKVLSELGDAEAALAARSREPIGRLHVNMPVAFGRSHVMPLLTRVVAQHAQLQLHASFSDRFVDLADEAVDVAVRIGGGDQAQGSSSLASRALGRERLIFCASPRFLKRCGRRPNDPYRAAMEYESVSYRRMTGQPVPWRISSVGGVEELSLGNVRVAVGHGEGVVDAVVAGCGIAQLATWLVADELASGKLVEILKPWATDGLGLSVIWMRSRQLVPKIDVAVRALCKGLKIAPLLR